MLAPEETPLVIEDRLARMNLLPPALSFDHRIDERFQLRLVPALDAEPAERIGMESVVLGKV